VFFLCLNGSSGGEVDQGTKYQYNEGVEKRGTDYVNAYSLASADALRAQAYHGYTSSY
jgi:hypothetical protein